MGGEEADNAVTQIIKGLEMERKEIPFYLLYDEKGSALYDEITKQKSYYPYAAEKALLEQYAGEIVGHFSPECVLVELGCGTARKTIHLLNAFQSTYGSCRFVGVDVSDSALREASTFLETEAKNPKCFELKFIQAQYMQGLKAVRRLYPDTQLCVLWLGSSIGNLSQSGAISFLKDVTSAVGNRYQLFLCTDMWKDHGKLLEAYKEECGVTERFIKNGMKNALQHILSRDRIKNLDKGNDWIYEVEINKDLQQVEMYVCFPSGLEDLEKHVSIRAGERVLVEISRKFTAEAIYHLAHEAGMRVHASWRNLIYGCQIMAPAEVDEPNNFRCPYNSA